MKSDETRDKNDLTYFSFLDMRKDINSKKLSKKRMRLSDYDYGYGAWCSPYLCLDSAFA